MNDRAIGRRTFLTTAGAAALTAAGALDAAPGHDQQPVRNSTGTQPSKVKAPANAADCHIHIYDPRFLEPNPRPGLNPKNATVQDYRLVQRRTGPTMMSPFELTAILWGSVKSPLWLPGRPNVERTSPVVRSRI
jgi:hypothetical protein